MQHTHLKYRCKVSWLLSGIDSFSWEVWRCHEHLLFVDYYILKLIFDTVCSGCKNLGRSSRRQQRVNCVGSGMRQGCLPSGVLGTSILEEQRPAAQVSYPVGPAAPGGLAGDQASVAGGKREVLRTCFTFCHHKKSGCLAGCGSVEWSSDPLGGWNVISNHFLNRWWKYIPMHQNHWFNCWSLRMYITSLSWSYDPNIFHSTQIKSTKIKRLAHFLSCLVCLVVYYV